MGKFNAKMVASILSLLTIAIATFFAMGYIFNQPNLYTWPTNATPVALPTSIIFIIVGSSVFILSARTHGEVYHRFDVEDDRLDLVERRVNRVESMVAELRHQNGNGEVSSRSHDT